jgi:hypothetical protein
MLRLILWFKANYSSEILGKIHIYILRLTFMDIVLYIGPIII